jgi:hypothetical protein
VGGFPFSTEIKVRFAETDAQGIAHHARWRARRGGVDEACGRRHEDVPADARARLARGGHRYG